MKTFLIRPEFSYTYLQKKTCNIRSKSPLINVSMPPLKLLVKTTVILLWIVLLGMLVQRELLIPKLDTSESIAMQKAREQHFYGIWFNKHRIGYAVEQYVQAPSGSVRLSQEAKLHLRVLSSTQTINMELTGELSPSMHLQSFDFRFISPFYSMHAEGKVKGNTVSFSLDTGRDVTSDTITLSSTPLLPLNARSYLLEQLPQPGDRVKVPYFDPLTLSPRESVAEYLGKQKTLVNKTMLNLHHFTDTHSGVETHFWLNDKGQTVKEVSPAGFTFLAEPEFLAKDITPIGDELLSTVAVKYRGTLQPADAPSASYRLSLPDKEKYDLEGGRQTYSEGVLTINRETLAFDQFTDPCNGGGHLEPTRYVQSNDEAIVKQALDIVGEGAVPQMEKVKRLATWVFQTIDKRPVIGLPDALSTLHNKRGDCNEHAALFAALARAVGIPTVIATGVTLQKDAFFYHAWNEVCLNDQWISLDTTTNQLPADSYHLRLARGDLVEQLKVGSLIGKLEIEALEEQ